MILYFLKTAFNSFLRNRFSSMYNFIGLSLGLTVFMLILLYVLHEYSTNRFYRDAGRIYCVSIDGSDRTPYVLGDGFRQQMEELEDVCRVQFWDFKFNTLRNEQQTPLDLDNIIRADANFFDFFEYKFIQGDPHTALQQPESIVLTESSARKLFGDENPLGKTIRYNRNQMLLMITGIIKDPPPNLSFKLNAVMSVNSLPVIYPSYQNTDQGFWSFNTFIKLKSSASYSGLNEKASAVMQIMVPSNHPDNLMDEKRKHHEVKLHSLKMLYFDNTIKSSFFRQGNTRQIYVFSSVAILVLLVAVINSINLFGAQAEQRLNEVRIRKTTGAGFWHILCQLMTETMMISFFSILLALFFTAFIVEIINSWENLQIPLYYFSVRELFLILMTGAPLTGFLIGLYPAFYLYLNHPKQSIKPAGMVKVLSGAGGSLIVFQLVVSITLIVVSLTMLKQFRFMMNYDLGFDAGRIVCVKLNKDIAGNHNSFVSRLSQCPYIERQARANEFFMVRRNLFPVKVMAHGNEHLEEFNVFVCDTGFVEVLGLRWLSTLNLHLTHDSVSAIVNEAALNRFTADQKENISFPDLHPGRKVLLAGVVNNFNYMPLQELQGPFLFLIQPHDQNLNALYFRLVDDDKETVNSALDYISATWKEFSPDEPAEIKVLENIIRNFYIAENFQRKIFTGFTLLSIIISCLGLYGLTIFILQRKIKEIGIRKVNGARVFVIVKMMVYRFAGLVIFSFMLAAPVVYYAMDRWLNEFAYKTTLSWWIFFLAGSLALLISLLTVGWQSWRAAAMNPVDALRYE